MSPNTVAKAYRLLARIMDTAVEAGVLLRNLCSEKGAATERAAEMRVATVAQVAALAEAIHPRCRALVLVAAYAELRWGELVGLRVKRVDLLHSRITVAEQATEIAGHFTWGATQDRGWPANRDPAGGRGRCPGRAPGHLQRARPGWAGVPLPRGWLLRRSNFGRRVWRPATRAAGVEGLRFMICGIRRPRCRLRRGRARGS